MTDVDKHRALNFVGVSWHSNHQGLTQTLGWLSSLNTSIFILNLLQLFFCIIQLFISKRVQTRLQNLNLLTSTLYELKEKIQKKGGTAVSTKEDFRVANQVSLMSVPHFTAVAPYKDQEDRI